MSNLMGELKESRKTYSIGDIAELKYGFGLPERDRKVGAVPVYGSSGAVGYHAEAAVKKSSIIIGRKGNVGSVFYSPIASYPIDTVYFIDQPNKGFDLKYVYYLLSRVNLPRYGGDSAVPGLSREAVYSIEVQVPNEHSQKKIAEILGAYDEKIENNNRIIKTLEQMAQAIFNEWFVKFRFPGYEKVKMVDSESGLIPEGWEVKSLDEVADFLNGVPLQKFPPKGKDDELPVIKIREMNSGIDASSEKASKKIDAKYIIQNGDILFSWSGSLDVMQWFGGEAVLNQHIFKVTSARYPAWFFYLLIKKAIPFFRVIASGKATTMGHIQRHHLTDWKVLIPEARILEKADNILKPIFHQRFLMKIENNNLKASRDQLLKKII